MRIFLTLALLATVLVAVPAAKADACSCALMSTDAMLENHEAAFVGTMIERGTEVTQDEMVGESVEFTFEVEQWLKGDLGETLAVRSSTSGASCGFEIPVGERAAIFLYQNNGEWWSGLCSTMSADVALAGLVPLDVGSTDPPFAILYGGSGNQRLLVIDAQGDIISLLPDADRDSWQESVNACPGGERIVESTEKTIRVRALPDLAIERQLEPGGDYIRKVWCLSHDGSKILALVTISRPDSEITRLIDQDGRVYYEGRAWIAEVVDNTAYVAANEGKLLVGIDLTTAESKVVYRAETANGGYGGVEILNRAGTMLTFVSNAYVGDESTSVLVVVDGATGEVVGERQLDGTANAQWIGPNLIGVASTEEGGVSKVYDAATLDEVGTMPTVGGSMAVAGDIGVGIEEGRLIAFSNDEVRTLRTYPNAYLWNVAIIDPTITPEIPADAPIVQPVVQPTDTTVPTTVPPPAAPDPAPTEPATNPTPWIVGISALLLTAAIVTIRRKTT